MTVFHKAWAFLKASRQTELGEFHPDFPSSYGPVTMVRQHPTEDWLDEFMDGGMLEEYGGFDENMWQPYESLITQGLRPHEASLESHMWEEHLKDEDGYGDAPPVKHFNLDGKGSWFYPSGIGPDEQTIIPDERRKIGVRIPINNLQGQFRNEGGGGEPAEAWIQQHIPPTRLTQIPDNWVGETKDWGERGE